MSELEASEFLLPFGLCSPVADASKLTYVQKEELLCEAAKGSTEGREVLECWKRKDLLQLICLEMGKERKYTGLPKAKLVDLLLNLVSRRVVDGPHLGSQGLSLNQQRNTSRPLHVSAGHMDEDGLNCGFVSTREQESASPPNQQRKAGLLSYSPPVREIEGSVCLGFAFPNHQQELHTAPTLQRKAGCPLRVPSAAGMKEDLSFALPTCEDRPSHVPSVTSMDKDVLSHGYHCPPLKSDSQTPSKRQRKVGHPPLGDHLGKAESSTKAELLWVCRNVACRAHLQPAAQFCKRCSCCICQKFDDNKDPSLWLVCTPDPVGLESNCGFSCHLECALNKKLAGVVLDESSNIVLDGGYHCGSCGKVTNLMSCWQKQLKIAQDARRVDIFCQRLSLSHRILNGTQKYKKLHEIVEEAMKMLETEVGPLEGSAKLARCIVNRLSSSAELQKLICKALAEANALHLERSTSAVSMAADKQVSIPCTVELNEATSSSIMLTVKSEGYVAGEPVIGYKIWHRRVISSSYPENPTCVIPGHVISKAVLSGLEPGSKYVIRILPFTEKFTGKPFEAQFSSKGSEVSSAADQQHPVISNEINTDLLVLADCETNFKVRDLGKSLHSVWGLHSQTMNASGGGLCSNEGKNDGKEMCKDEATLEKKKSHAKPALEVLHSPGVAASSVGGSVSKLRLQSNQTDSNTAATGHFGMEEGKVTSEAKPTTDPTESFSRKQQNEVTGSPQKQVALAKGMEVDDVSDLDNSHTSRREETGAVSPNVSESLEVDAGTKRMTDGLEKTVRFDDADLNGQNISWAVQVRNLGTAMRLDPQTSILRSRGIGGLQSCFLEAVDGCGTSGMGAPLCAAKNYEFCVKIIRWLECEGHLKADFRMKFLTWFSLRASDHERQVVNVFIDTLQDDPASLAEQLMDTFGDFICLKSHSLITESLHKRLWH